MQAKSRGKPRELKNTMNLLTKLFGGSPAKARHSHPTAQDPHYTLAEQSENASRRQLVQVLLRDLLRRNGVKAEWIQCQTLVVNSRTRGAGMYLRVIVNHWDERLMRYLHALQTEFMADIAQFEPSSASWLLGISWQLEVKESCPYQKMPERDFWAEKPGATVSERACAPLAHGVAKPMSFAPTQTPEDLEKLFAVRDREIDRQSAEGIASVGYESTQPAPL